MGGRQDTRRPLWVGGLWCLFEVTGGRAPSFRGLSVGESAAPPKVENVGGGKNPPRISHRKDQPGALESKKRDHRPPTGLRGNPLEIVNPGFRSKIDVSSIDGALDTDLLTHKFL